MKLKQTEYKRVLILNCELDVRMSDVSVRELLHFIFDAGSVVFN